MASAQEHQVVWERAIRLASKIHTATRPGGTAHGLIGQMRRCSIAVASQLADAYSRPNRAERIRLLGLARASLFELDTQVRVSIDLQALDPAFGVEGEVSVLQRMLTSSIERLRQQPDRYGPLRVVNQPCAGQACSPGSPASAPTEALTGAHRPRALGTRT
jgi:four helix bundle protein